MKASLKGSENKNDENDSNKNNEGNGNKCCKDGCLLF